MSNVRTRRQTRRSSQSMSGAGQGVDIYGGPAIDPTENVLALVDAESKYRDELRIADTRLQDALREAESRYQSAMREGEARYQSAMREAEVRSIGLLSSQKQLFDLELAKVLRDGLATQLVLLTTQLQETKKDLSDRVGELQQFRWSSGGRTSILAWIFAGLSIVVAIAAIVVRM